MQISFRSKNIYSVTDMLYYIAKTSNVLLNTETIFFHEVYVFTEFLITGKFCEINSGKFLTHYYVL